MSLSRVHEPPVTELESEYVCRSLAECQRNLCRIKARLQVLRGHMNEVEWRDFLSDRPEAEKWFDQDGVPR